MANSGIRSISRKIDKIHDMVFENYKNIAVIKAALEAQNSKIKSMEETLNEHSSKLAEARGGLIVLGILVSLLTIAKMIFGW